MSELEKIIRDLEAIFEEYPTAVEAVEKVAARLEGIHAVGIAEAMLEFAAAERKTIFDALSNERAADVLVEIDEVSQREFLDDTAEEKISDLVEEMPPDEGADIVELLSPEKQATVLDDVADEQAESIRELIQYDPDTAGGIMTTEYVAVSPDWTISRVIEEIRLSPDLESLAQIYVLGPGNVLAGVASLRRIITAGADELIGEVMDPEVISVRVKTDQEEVARVVEQYDITAVPVVDAAGALKGIVTVDDVLDVVEEEASEDILRIAGTLETHPVQERIARRIALRLPWLLITLAGGLIAFLTMEGAEHTLTRLLSIASFVPLVVGCAGSVGVQTSTIIARGLATGEVRVSMLRRILVSELAVALGIGVVCGVVAAGASILLAENGGVNLGLIVGLSMVAAIGVAALMGTIIPLACYRLGIDPALAAGPFVTSFNDVVGLAIYLSIATQLLN